MRMDALPETMQERDARFSAALGHPIRVDIMGVLNREGQLSPREITERLGHPTRKVRTHLATLERVGVVERPAGESRYRARTGELTDWLTAMRELACGALLRDPVSPGRR